MAANVIYRGPVKDEPKTQNRAVVGAYLPGTFVKPAGEALTMAKDGKARLLILSNRRFYKQSVDDAYEAGDTGVAYEARPQEQYQVRFAAGTYSRGAALTVNANGQAAAAVAGNVVVAFFDGPDGSTIAAGALADIAIANIYVAA